MTEPSSSNKQTIRGVVPRRAIDLQRQVRDRRITSASPYTSRLFVHHFRVELLAELDDEFLGWLREAYAVGNGAHLRT